MDRDSPMYENSAIPLVHISPYHGESDGSNNGEGNEFRDDGPNGDAQNTSKYPMLSKLGVDLDLLIGVNESYTKDLIGECSSLQSALERRRKATISLDISLSLSLCQDLSLSRSLF